MEGERIFLQESDSVETSALPQLNDEKILHFIFYFFIVEVEENSVKCITFKFKSTKFKITISK
jgi:hypothetical protein